MVSHFVMAGAVFCWATFSGKRIKSSPAPFAVTSSSNSNGHNAKVVRHGRSWLDALVPGRV